MGREAMPSFADEHPSALLNTAQQIGKDKTARPASSAPALHMFKRGKRDAHVPGERKMVLIRGP